MKTLGWLIAVSALLITIPRYASVFSGIDDTYLTALGMGVLLAGGAAYIFHTWARTKRKDAWMLLVAFGLNLLYEPFIISPYVLARLHGLTLAQAMSQGYSVFWSIIVAAAPVVLVGGVVLAISFQREKRKTTTKTEQEHSEPEPEPEGAEPEPEPQFATKKEHIRYLMAYEPGLSQTELAARTGASASYVSEQVNEVYRTFDRVVAHKTKGEGA